MTSLALPKPTPEPKSAPKRIARSSRPARQRKTRRGLSESMVRGLDKRESLMAQADKLCGQIVRARGRCEVCGSVKVLQWAHGLSRRYHNVRWDHEDNGFCLCAACHLHFTHNPLMWEQWLLIHLGIKRYDALRQRALVAAKPDIALVVVALKADHARLVKA